MVVVRESGVGGCEVVGGVSVSAAMGAVDFWRGVVEKMRK